MSEIPVMDGQTVMGRYMDVDGRFVFVPADAPEARRIAEQHAQHRNNIAAAYSSLDKRFGGAPEPQLVPYDDRDPLQQAALRDKAEHARRLRLMGYNV